MIVFVAGLLLHDGSGYGCYSSCDRDGNTDILGDGDGNTDISGDGLHGEARQAGDGQGGCEPGQGVMLYSTIEIIIVMILKTIC